MHQPVNTLSVKLLRPNTHYNTLVPLRAAQQATSQKNVSKDATSSKISVSLDSPINPNTFIARTINMGCIEDEDSTDIQAQYRQVENTKFNEIFKCGQTEDTLCLICRGKKNSPSKWYFFRLFSIKSR